MNSSEGHENPGDGVDESADAPFEERLSASLPDGEEAATEPIDDEPALEPEVVAGNLALENELLDLQARLRDTESKLKAVSSGYTQQQQEFERMRERNARLLVDTERRLVGESVQVFFEPVQNLRRSVDSLSKAGLSDDVVSGIRIVLRQFLDAMEGLGLEEVPGVGTPFDPAMHEALTTKLVADEVDDGRVVEVFDSGYRIGDQVIRAARVVIGRYQEPAGDA